jgi:hypothetical protein
MSFSNDNTIDKQVKEALDKRVGGAIKKGITTEYIELLRDRIVKRTRLGIGVDPESGAGVKLEPLSDNYKEMRQGKARFYTNKAGKVVKVEKNKDNSDYVKKPKLAGTTRPA